MYRDPIIAAAWAQADNGRGFAAALAAQGYRLAQGRKRLVVLDPYGHAHNPVRHIEGIRTKEFDQKLGDLDRATLPEANAAAKAIVEQNRQRYEASLRHDEHVRARPPTAGGAPPRTARDPNSRTRSTRASPASASNTSSTTASANAGAGHRSTAPQHRKIPDGGSAFSGSRAATANETRGARTHATKTPNGACRSASASLEAKRATALARIEERQREEVRRFEHRQKHELPRDYANEAERDKMRAAFEPARDARTPRGLELER